MQRYKSFKEAVADPLQGLVGGVLLCKVTSPLRRL